MELIINAIANLLVFVFGASVGSFLNVVIYRIPAGKSILYPPSHCPVCSHRLGKSENVPVFGWLWLRGRCRHCRTPISVRYPLIETLGGILFLFVFWQFELSWYTLGYWALLSWLLALAMVDLDTLTLPNPLTRSGLVAGLLFQAVIGWHSGELSGSANQLMSGIVGAVVGIWLFDLVAFVGSAAFGQEAMGAGDAKLAALIGAWLGWKYLLLTGFLACVLGAVIGGGAIALHLLSRRQPMPFGPFLAIAAGISVFLGDGIISTYLDLFFPTL